MENKGIGLIPTVLQHHSSARYYNLNSNTTMADNTVSCVDL